MARGKSGNPVSKERLLQVLANGGVITKRQIELTMQYKYMYRIPTELWKLKKLGAIVKSHKEGREVVAYELVNADEMKKLLQTRGFDVLPLVSDDSGVKALSDLNAQPAPVKAAKTKKAKVAAPAEVDEVTELTD
jgi:predicted transcriptional regulator